MPAKTATEAWRIPEIKYRGSEKVVLFKLQSLWKEFDNLLMAENKTIHSFFDRVNNIVYQIRSNGGKIEDENVIRKILRSLSQKYNIIATIIEEVNKKNLSQLSIPELMGSLLAHEDRLKRFNEEPLEQAFQAKLKFSNGENKNSHCKNYEKGQTSTNHSKGERIF